MPQIGIARVRTARTVKLGVVFPQTQFPLDPEAVRYWASTCASLGYDHVLAYDHVVGAVPELHVDWSGGYTSRDTFQEPLVLFGFLAACCRLELCTAVLVAPQRQTMLIAKQAAQVAMLAEGRFRLGVGIGWNRVEYDALGVPFERRGDRLEEQIDLLRRAWAGPIDSYQGDFHQVQGVALAPVPARAIPIWIGAGSTRRALERIGRLADGWIVQGQPGEQLVHDREVVYRAMIQSGRDPASLGIQGRINVAGKSPDWIAERARMWQEFGASHLAVNTMSRESTPTVDEHLESLSAARKALDTRT